MSSVTFKKYNDDCKSLGAPATGSDSQNIANLGVHQVSRTSDGKAMLVTFTTEEFARKFFDNFNPVKQVNSNKTVSAPTNIELGYIIQDSIPSSLFNSLELIFKFDQREKAQEFEKFMSGKEKGSVKRINAEVRVTVNCSFNLSGVNACPGFDHAKECFEFFRQIFPSIPLPSLPEFDGSKFASALTDVKVVEEKNSDTIEICLFFNDEEITGDITLVDGRFLGPCMGKDANDKPIFEGVNTDEDWTNKSLRIRAALEKKGEVLEYLKWFFPEKFEQLLNQK